MVKKTKSEPKSIQTAYALVNAGDGSWAVREYLIEDGIVVKQVDSQADLKTIIINKFTSLGLKMMGL